MLVIICAKTNYCPHIKIYRSFGLIIAVSWSANKNNKIKLAVDRDKLGFWNIEDKHFWYIEFKFKK